MWYRAVAAGDKKAPSISSNWSTSAGGASTSAVTRNEAGADGLLGHGVVEPVVHRAAHTHAEEPGDGRGQGDLAGGVRVGQPPGQHGQGVLAVERAVDAARDRVGEEGVVDVAAHDRVGGQSGPGRTGAHAGQLFHLGDERCVRRGDVDHHIAGVDCLQVAPVGRLRPPGAGQGRQRHGAQHAGEEYHHQRGAPCRPPGGPPPIQGHRHWATAKARP